MRKVRRYLDTSILVEALASQAPHHEAAKHLIAEVAASGSGLVSVLVLSELLGALTKAAKGSKPAMGHVEAMAAARWVADTFDVTGQKVADWDDVVTIRRKYQQWPGLDALHWATARRAGCREFLTLDRPGGPATIGGVRFVNPFG